MEHSSVPKAPGAKGALRRFLVRMRGDSDFVRTVEGFVKDVAPRVFHGDWREITKPEMVALFNAHAYAFYCVCQCGSMAGPPQEKAERLRAYLFIEEQYVLFDDEVDTFEVGHWNGDGVLAYVDHKGVVWFQTI